MNIHEIRKKALEALNYDGGQDTMDSLNSYDDRTYEQINYDKLYKKDDFFKETKESLYIIRLGKYYKIGYSKNPYKRLKQLDITKLPEEPVLKYVLYKDYYENDDKRDYKKLEKKIHRELSRFNKRGEWFKLNEKKLLLIVKKYGFSDWEEIEADFYNFDYPLSHEETGNLMYN